LEKAGNAVIVIVTFHTSGGDYGVDNQVGMVDDQVGKQDGCAANFKIWLLYPRPVVVERAASAKMQRSDPVIPRVCNTPRNYQRR
jgi:hypothetical protein